jgi:hypothetical protein
MRWTTVCGVAGCALAAAACVLAADLAPRVDPAPRADPASRSDIVQTAPVPSAALPGAPATVPLGETVRVPYAPDVLVPIPEPQRSVVVDRDAADRLSVLSDSSVTYRLFVEGRGDARVQPKTFERRFADSLNGSSARSPVRFSQQVMDTTPCPTLASAGTPFGPAYRVYGFCP